MKEFNLEEAKAGKRVCTRDGKSARIVCWDLNYGNGKILALVILNADGHEYPVPYTNEGKAYTLYGDMDAKYDLMMAPEKHEAWVIMKIVNNDIGFVGKTIFHNYEDAEACMKEEIEETGDVYGIAHLEWED